MQLLTALFFAFLSALQFAAAAPGDAHLLPAAKLVVRQATTGGAPANQPVTCAEYSTVANLSVIGTNSSYRAAFLQKSPTGTLANAAMFKKAQLRLPALTADAALNRQCGNLTQVALTEAARNLTQGIVAQFTTAGLPVGIRNGPEVIVCVLASMIIMSGVWVFAA